MGCSTRMGAPPPLPNFWVEVSLHPTAALRGWVQHQQHRVPTEASVHPH